MLLKNCSPIERVPLQRVDVPSPEPGPGEVRLRVVACAICRTDLHVIEGDLPRPKLPLIPGHQIVGTVDRLGSGCQRLKVGSRVGVAWLRQTCGVCPYCRSKRENLCESARFTGYHADGGFAEQALVPEDFAYVLPDAMDAAEAAPLLCAGIIGYRALERSELPPGGRLGIFGFGSSAHLVIQIAKARGARIFVITRGEGHRRLALSMGAEWVGGTTEGLPEKLASAILFAPAGELVPPALRALEKGGTVCLAGIHMSEIPAMSYTEHLFYEKNLRSVTANTRRDGEALLTEAAKNRIHPKVTRYRLEDANQALLDLKQDRINGTGILMVRDEL
jgi:propanol-preferring alcohol dehydrogenase